MKPVGPARILVTKTPKVYVGGAFIRSESMAGLAFISTSNYHDITDFENPAGVLSTIP